MSEKQAYIIEDLRKNPRKDLKELSFFKRKDFNIIVNRSETKEQIKTADVYRIALTEINVNHKLFQQRKKAYSQSSVNKIIQAYNTGNFKIEVFDPILLWKSAEDGKLYILSGHSRTQAFRQLAKINPEFNTIPAKIIEVSQEEAESIAKKSNTLSTKETDSERANYYYNLRQDGVDIKEILKECQTNEERESNRIFAYSFLNPSGIVIDALEMLERGEVQSRSQLQSIAHWIGQARLKYIDKLTNEHESELYKWLMFDNGFGQKAGQVSNINEFLKKVDYLINRQGFMFDKTQPLNIKNIQQKSTFMQDYESRLNDVEKELNEAKKERESKRLKFIRAGKNNVEVIELLRPYDAAINRAAQEFIRLKNQYSQVIDAEKKQGSLFGLNGLGIVYEFFNVDSIKDFADLKKQYRKLAMIHHPDKGGTDKDMQRINFEYENLFDAITKGKNLTEEEIESEIELDEKFKEIIEQLINIPGLEIEIIGSWIWLSGNTYPNREKIKSLEFKFAGQKKMWYWHAEGFRKSSKKNFTIDEIRDFYKSEKIKKRYNSNVLNGNKTIEFVIDVYLNNEISDYSDNFTSLKKANDYIDYLVNNNIPFDKIRISKIIDGDGEYIKTIKNNSELGKPYTRLEFDNNIDALEFSKNYQEFLKQKINPTKRTYNKKSKNKPFNDFNFNLNGIAPGIVELKHTYKISELIPHYPQSENITNYLGEGGVSKTLDVVLSTVKDYSHTIKDFANKIKGDSLNQTCFNIWYFLRTQTIYKNDKPGYEEIRTPGRLIFDAVGDCDDYATFTASVLTELNYKPFFYVVAYNSGNYAHIYCGCENIVIDAVMKTFNEHPDHITKTMILQLDGNKKIYNKSPKDMKIEQLRGLPSNDNTQHYLLTGYYQTVINDIMPHVAKMQAGKLYFDNGEIVQVIENYINGVENINSIAGDSFYNVRSEFLGATKAERDAKKEVRKDKREDKKETKKENKEERKDAKKERKEERKDMTTSEKINTFVKVAGLAPARGAYLLLLKVNFLRQASKLYIGLLSESEAKAMNLNYTEYIKAKTATNKFIDFWVKNGGLKETLIQTIKAGRGKKYVEKSIKGLGVEPATAATAATAGVALSTPFWSKVVTFFKSVDFKTLIGTAKDKFEDLNENLTPQEQDAENKANDITEDTDSDNNNNNTEDLNMKNILIGLGIVGTLTYLLTRK